jgi:tRNA(fMet)-specific endonuclease VapC
MTRYMLDTNTVSFLLRGHPSVTARTIAQPMSSLSISAITEAELLFGVAKRPEAKRLKTVVFEFLNRVDVLPWDRAAADCYGTMRAALEKRGKVLAPLDLLIGCHAMSAQHTLVTNDQAFAHVTGLRIVDWV